MTKVLANLVAANVITQKVYGKQVVFVVRQVCMVLRPDVRPHAAR